MINVYVVWRSDPFDGDGIEGIFAKAEDAEKYAKELREQEAQNPNQLLFYVIEDFLR